MLTVCQINDESGNGGYVVMKMTSESTIHNKGPSENDY